MIKLLFGTREVGTLSLQDASGIGEPLFEHGLDSVRDTRHYSRADGEKFLAAVLTEFQGGYFKAVCVDSDA